MITVTNIEAFKERMLLPTGVPRPALRSLPQVKEEPPVASK